MKPLLSLTRASLLGFARDRAALTWTLVFPIAILALFSALFGGGSNAPDYKIDWVDDAHTARSASVRTALEGAGVFTITDADDATAREAMKAGRVKGIVEAPERFGDDPAVRLRLLVDPSDRSTAGAIAAFVDRAISAQSQDGGSGAMEIVPIQGQGLTAASYLVPSFLAMALMQLGIYGAVTLVQQRERQILKRLASAPIDRWSIVGSFVGTRLVVAVVQTVVMLVAGRFLIGSELTGSPILVGGLVLLTAATFIAIGFAIAGLAPTEESATQITGVVSLPLMFLSGLFIPVDQLPDFIRPLAAVMPLTYAADALRQVMVGGTPFVPLTIGVAVLAAWLLGSLVVATRLFRWQ
jgi:ABC-2 type transport system permease protein